MKKIFILESIGTSLLKASIERHVIAAGGWETTTDVQEADFVIGLHGHPFPDVPENLKIVLHTEISGLAVPPNVPWFNAMTLMHLGFPTLDLAGMLACAR